MRIAWLSPLPPAPSGISDYSAELLPLLAERAEVEAFAPRPGRFKRLRPPPGVAVRPPELLDPSHYDAVYHHLGNNPHHTFVYEAARRHPGICVLHDLSLHHMVAYLTAEVGWDPERYRAICVEDLGPELGERVSGLKLRGVAGRLEKFWFPLVRHVARRARGIVVHSRWGQEQIAQVAPGVPVETIPVHTGHAPAAVARMGRAEARRELGLPPEAFIVGHFGFLGPEKQPGAILQGLARLRPRHPSSLLVVVGADNTGGGLARAARRHGVHDAVRATGFVDLPTFYRYLKAVDAVVNLRYPSAGESSAALARALSEGRAVIVDNYQAFGELPADIALKVEVDGPQGRQLGDHLLRLADDAAFKQRLESRARAHAAQTLDPIRCRDRYLSFAEMVGSPGPRAQ